MTYTKTYIYNVTLNNLGVSEPIQSENDSNDPRVALLNNYYNMARDTVLEAHDWKFASRFQTLSNTLECPDPNYLFAYHYPNDCISPRALMSQFDQKEKKFELTTNTSGEKIILAEHNPCILRYTARIENESQYTAPFVSALSFYLAYLTSQVITGSANKKNTNLQDYQIAIKNAVVTDARKKQIKDEDDNDYTDYR